MTTAQPATPHGEPTVSQHLPIIRVCLIFNRAMSYSRPAYEKVNNRLIDPTKLPVGTWAVQHFEEDVVVINDQMLSAGPVRSTLTLLAARLYTGRDFAKKFQDVADALGHDGKRPVIQLPSDAYNFNSEDISGQYRVVPKGVRVIDQRGEMLWPKCRQD